MTKNAPERKRMRNKTILNTLMQHNAKKIFLFQKMGFAPHGLCPQPTPAPQIANNVYINN